MPKISQLSQLSAVTADDLFVVVDNPSASPSTKRVTAQTLLQFVESGLGVIGVANGGTGSTTLTGYVKGNGTGPFSAAATIPGSEVSGNIAGSAANVTGVVAVANGGTGATNTTALASSLGFGTLANQNQNNVTITGGSISIDGLFNVGLGLSSNSFSTAKMSARSAVTDFKAVGQVPIFTVPAGHMFLVDTMEIVTTSITSAGMAPSVRFGITGDENLFYPSARSTSNSFGERHVIENPQNGVDAGSVVSFGVTEASTADAHSGVAVVTGYLLKKT
jgi:hypothetical protein